MMSKGWKIKCSCLLIYSLVGIFLPSLPPYIQFYGFIYDHAYATEFKKPDYYPLSVGNQWTFELKDLKEVEKVPKRYYNVIITRESDIGNGMTQYYTEGGKEFLITSKEGILTSTGIFLLKYPLAEGESWISGQWNYDQRLFKVKKVDFSITLKGRRYDNCIKVIETSDFHAIVKKDREIEYLASESCYYYATNVGPVLTETFEIKRSGERTPVYRSELVSFDKGKPVSEAQAKLPSTQSLVSLNQSFRFPEKGFIHPILSPDDKWLIYQRTENVGKELYYTELGKKYERIVPLCQAGEEKSLREIGIAEWSPDGRVFAVRVDRDHGNQIVLVDFSRDQPVFMESLDADRSSFGGSFYWSSEGFIVYLGKRGTIIRKFPRKQPEEFVVSSAGSISFQIASNGTILYRSDQLPDRPVYLSNLQKPSTKIRIFTKVRIDSFDLSPNGEHALLYDCTDQNNRVVTLANLKTLQIKNKWPIRSEPWLEAKWSPDGSKLAYVEKTFPQKSKEDPSKTVWLTPNFYILALATGNTRDYGIGISKEFNWTPDGGHIIYSMKHAHESLGTYHNGIFIMRVSDGKEIGQLTKVSAHMNLKMSPSSKYVVWEALNMNTFFVAENPFRSKMLER